MQNIKKAISNKTIKVISGIIIITLIIGISIFAITKLSNNKKPVSIITSNFISYDFTRAVTGDSSIIAMLTKAGTETHNYEPTPEDIINIKNADLLVYNGGESDKWLAKLLDDNEIPKEKTLRLMSLVETKKEELPKGIEQDEPNYKHEYNNHEEKTEYDEHIWTSPINAIKLVNGIKDKLSTIHPEHKANYTKNADSYTSRLSDIDTKIRNTIVSSNKKKLVFGDRFPFRYFVDEYGLDYYAAFPGCSEQTEASSQTIAFLIDQVKTNHIKTILKIELTSDKLAQTIANETGAKVMTLSAAHNISQADFDNGLTYADIMEKNIKVLKEALE